MCCLIPALKKRKSPVSCSKQPLFVKETILDTVRRYDVEGRLSQPFTIMKPLRCPFKPLILVLLTTSFLSTTHVRAAVTGQWDFKTGNLSATVGQDMQYLDNETQTGTQFGTTTALGVSNIAGQSTNVMKFPKVSTEFGGYGAQSGAGANGGGSFINQYSVIMDVLFPAASSGKVRALFVTDMGGDFFANASDALTFAGGSIGGNLTSNTWHRIAYTVDTTSTISIFVDGIKVDEEATPGGLDGSFSVVSGINLFDDANTNSQIGYVASIQFQDQKLSDGFINSLGGPQPGGIRTGPPPNPYVVSEAPTSDLRLPARSAPMSPCLQMPSSPRRIPPDLFTASHKPQTPRPSEIILLGRCNSWMERCWIRTVFPLEMKPI